MNDMRSYWMKFGLLVLVSVICIKMQCKTVTLTNAGTLSQFITENEKYSLTELKIVGPINGTDIRFLREMADAFFDNGDAYKDDDSNRAIPPGHLEFLDLSDARIYKGGVAYYENNVKKYYVENDDEIPIMCFQACKPKNSPLKKVILPKNLLKIRERAFRDNRNLAELICFDKLEEIEYAFAGCYSLEKIDLPSSLRILGKNAFTNSGLKVLNIPEGVTTIGEDAFSNAYHLRELHIPSTVQSFTGTIKQCSTLGAVYWNAPIKLEAPNYGKRNFLVYAPSKENVDSTYNVIVNGVAEHVYLTLSDGIGGFWAPEPFLAKEIDFTYYYQNTKKGECRGWSTIALPFEPQTITCEGKGEIVPISIWKIGDNTKPFWLCELSETGFTPASRIEAYTPYIIAMPGYDYSEEFRLSYQNITFSAKNVQFDATDEISMNMPKCNGKTFVPCVNGVYHDVNNYDGIYAINDRGRYNEEYIEPYIGDKFVNNSREIFPFEAYITTDADNTREYINISDFIKNDEILSVPLNTISKKDTMVSVYTLSGQCLKNISEISVSSYLKLLPQGIYIVNGKKVIITNN